jgi:hypothetical protein
MYRSFEESCPHHFKNHLNCISSNFGISSCSGINPFLINVKYYCKKKSMLST